MTDSEYLNHYLFHRQSYVNQKLKSIKIFSKDIILIEDVLGFQRWFDDKISNIENGLLTTFTDKEKTNPIMLDRIGLTHFIYRKNWNLLCSLYEIGLSDEFNLPNIIMRTIHEGILNLIYLATHENEASDIKLYMERQYNSAFNKFDEKHKNIKQYTPKYIKESLFTEEMKESMNKIYGGLSIATHPNIFENTRKLEEFDPRRVHEDLWFVLRESFYNMVFFIENFRKIPLIIDEIKADLKILSYIDNLKIKISEEGKIVDLFPNKGNLG